MSNDTDLVISVPRACVNEFYSKYLNLVETFYYVTLSENKTALAKERPDHVFFNVMFNLTPTDVNFQPRELIGRIQKYVESSLGWAGERGEDSSYDSECEDDGSHRAASRTPSDTLAAEFAEYVTLSTPHPNQAKIEFALKLGYSERLARTALQRLGPDPPCNELLAELINLAKQQPPRAPSPPPADPAAHVDRALLRHIVIDGSNVAMSHGNKEVFSCRGIEIAVDWFRARGHKEITVFVPKWRKEASRPDNPVAERDALERLERDRVLVYTPSRLLGGKRLVCYDDRYILRLAAETDGIVVSNDNYRDLAAESPDFRKVVEERLLMFSFVNDRFMPPDDPLGRAGPTLDAFLRAPPARAEPPPPACPYGRKCTYGNKCKFHHPERAGRPHKSVAEKLSERAARAFRARDLHTVSLPPGGRASTAAAAAAAPPAKRPLARAHSAAPRLPDAAALATHFERAQVAGPSQLPPPPLLMPQPQHPALSRHHTTGEGARARRTPVAAGRVASAPVGGAAAAAAVPAAAVPVPCASEGALPLAQWEARRRMHFHLAGIFPEAQVAEAMAAFPDEVDAQQMCAIILSRYRPSEAAPAPPPPPHVRDG